MIIIESLKPVFCIILLVALLFFGRPVSAPSLITADDVFINLISNKADLTYGEAIFEIKNPTAFTISNFNSANFGIDIQEYKGSLSDKTEILFNDTEYYTEEILDSTVCNPSKQELKNGTIESYDNCTNTYKTIQRSSEVWKDISKKTTFLPNEILKIKIITHWKAQLGEISKEWIPKITIGGVTYRQIKWAWWNTSYSSKKNDTITSTGAFSNFPYLLNSTAKNGCGYRHLECVSAGKCQVDGDDIRAVDNAETGTNPYEFEDYTNNTNNACVWISDTISNAQANYLYYNSATAVNAETPTSVWGSSYILVDHFQKITGTQSNDSTSNAHVGTLQGTASFVSGKFGSGYTNTPGGNYMSYPDKADLNLTGNWSIDFWIYLRSTTNEYQGVVTKLLGSAGYYAYYRASTSSLDFCFIDTTVTQKCCIEDSATTISTNVWTYVALVRNGTHCITYLNGKPVLDTATAGTNNILNAATPLVIGHGPWTDVDAVFDEFRISKIPLSPEWINATYQNVVSTLGTEQTNAANNYSVKISDTLSSKDYNKRNAKLSRKPLDSSNIADYKIDQFSFIKTMLDKMTYNDYDMRYAIYFKSFTEIERFVDYAKRNVNNTRSQLEIVDFLDYYREQYNATRLSVDLVRTNDYDSRAIIIFRSSADIERFIDYVSRNAIYLRSDSDIADFIDDYSRYAYRLRNTNDLMTLSDNYVKNSIYFRNTQEIEALVDYYSRFYIGKRNLTDVSTFIDTFNKHADMFKSLSEAMRTNDAYSKNLAYFKTLSDVKTFVDYYSSNSYLLRSTTDIRTLLDSYLRHYETSRVYIDGFNLDAYAIKNVFYFKDVTDLQMFLDYYSKASLSLRDATDVSAILDSYKRFAESARSASESSALSDYYLSNSIYFRNSVELKNFLDYLEKHEDIFRQTTSVSQIIDDYKRYQFLQRAALSSSNIVSVLTGYIMCFFGNSCGEADIITIIGGGGGGGGGSIGYIYIPILASTTNWTQTPNTVNLTTEHAQYFLQTITLANSMPYQINLSVGFEPFGFSNAYSWAHQLDDEMKYTNKTIMLQPGSPQYPSITYFNVEINVPEDNVPYQNRFWIVTKYDLTSETRRTLVTIDTRTFSEFINATNAFLGTSYVLSNPIFGIEKISILDIVVVGIIILAIILGYYILKKLFKEKRTEKAQQPEKTVQPA